MNTTIPCIIAPDGTLQPTPMGDQQVLIAYSTNIENGTSAIVSFGGMNQASINFDETGKRVINYTLLHPMATLQIQMTVENIINYLTAQQATQLFH